MRIDLVQTYSAGAYLCLIKSPGAVDRKNQPLQQSCQIPCTKAVASASFANAEGSTIAISPLGLVLDQRALFAEPAEAGGYDMAKDPVHVQSLVVKMDDGSAYTVFDGPAMLDNTLSLCGFEANLSMAFNRLVDPARVASVEAVVTDAATMDEIDANDSSLADWPTRTVVYTRA